MLGVWKFARGGVRLVAAGAAAVGLAAVILLAGPAVLGHCVGEGVTCEWAPGVAFAEEVSVNDGADFVYYMGEAKNTGKDNGYSGSDEIATNDVHFGWRLGRFCLSGYTRVVTDGLGSQDNPVFLKSVGDKISLSFTLEQNIDLLNGNENLLINDDTNGSDQHFGVQQSDFGRGMLIVRRTDYQNNTEDPVLYRDYLSGVEAGAATLVEQLEEGDYEVALDYEIMSRFANLFDKVDVKPTYTDYQILIKFSVRNGNCMVYPREVGSGNELTNQAFTESGFTLDLAKSQYLDINIKRQVMVEGADDLTEDTRFNTAAHDGQQFTDEGIYVITVKNRYTGEETTKQIYVGTDDVMKAHVVTGLSIAEINVKLAEGASITADGNIQDSTGTLLYVVSTGETADDAQADGQAVGGLALGGVAAVAVVVIVVVVVLVVRSRKRARGEAAQARERVLEASAEVSQLTDGLEADAYEVDEGVTGGPSDDGRGERNE